MYPRQQQKYDQALGMYGKSLQTKVKVPERLLVANTY